MSRRAPNNMGSIRQHKLGHWEAKISYTKPDGSKGRKSITGKTQTEVKERMLTLLADKQKGIPVRRDDKQTVSQYLELWLSGRRDLSENVLANYQ